MLSKQELADIAIEGQRLKDVTALQWFKENMSAIDRILLNQAKKAKRIATLRFWTKDKALAVLNNHPVAVDYYVSDYYYFKNHVVIFKW